MDRSSNPDPEDTLEAIKRGYIDDAMAVNAKRSLLLVGENVIVCPTEADQAVDRGNKYYLGLNVGKITAINHELQQVHLWWYYGKKWNDDSWIMWIDPKTNSPYKQWMSVEELADDDVGRIMRLTMEPSNRKRRHGHFKLSPSSIKTINLCLRLNKRLLHAESIAPTQAPEFDGESSGSDDEESE